MNGSNSVGGLIGHGGGSISYSHSDSYVTGITQVGGIFGYYTYSTMKECYSKGNVFGSGYFIGGLIGYSIESSFISCYSTSNVKGESLVGGLIGDNYHYNWQVKVYECFSTGNVTGSGVLGGLIGRNHGRSNYCNISNSYSTGNVNSSRHLIGGLVGENDAKIINCYSTGNVKGADFVGGLLGKNNYGLISYSYSTGEVVGEMIVGGFIGLNQYIVLSNCYSTGNVEGIYWVGGFVGHNNYGSVLNCYAKGNVIGIREIAGGLAGRNDGSISISYSVGKVVGGSIKGGLVGYNKGTVSDSFWDISTSGQISSAGGTGKNTEQMKTRSTFTNASWNFSGIWNIIENVTYPFFQWQYYNNDPEMINTSLSSDKIPIGDYIYINCTFFDKDTGDDHTGTIQWGDGNITQGSIMNYTLIGSHYYNNSGKYSIRIKISDSNGGSVSKTFNVTVTPKAKTGGPYVENEGSALCFNASGSLGENLSYRWDLDNDGIWDTNYSSDPTVNHTWYDDHSGYVTVEVYDGISTDTDTVEVTIYNVDPIVSFEYTVPEMFVLPGERIYFIGEFSDPGTEDTHTINWSFGDGNYLVGDLEVNHSFDDPGTYNVTLTVTDDDGGVGYYSAFITVIGQKEALEDLIEYIEDLGLNNGIQTSLVMKLENAIKKIDKGEDVDLKSFFNELDALKGNKISNSDYEYLYSLAQRIVS